MKKEILQYNGDFSKIVPIYKLEKQVIINALSFTNSIEHAAREIGITSRTLFRFMSDNNITNDDIKLLRRQFKLSNKKIKLRYDN